MKRISAFIGATVSFSLIVGGAAEAITAIVVTEAITGSAWLYAIRNKLK